jgi:protein-tyrosine phosphatase
LHRATESDSAALDRLGVTTVVDLRTDHERTKWSGCGAWDPEWVLHAPLLRTPWSRDEATDVAEPGAFLAARYLDMLNDSADVIAGIVKVFAEIAEPALFHCAAGKDRTGVVAAIVLGLLGVSEHAIIDDYHLTASSMPQLFALYAATDLDANDTMVAQPAAFLAAPRDAMALLLQAVRVEWGSIAGYVRSVGVSDETVHELRTRLVTP